MEFPRGDIGLDEFRVRAGHRGSEAADSVSALLLLPVYLYIIVGMGLFLSNADNHYGRVGLLPVAPTLAAVLFLLPLALFVVFTDSLKRPAFSQVSRIVRGNMAVLAPFLFLVGFSLFGSLFPEAYWGENSKYIYIIGYDFFIFVLAMLLPLIRFVRERFVLMSLCGLIALLYSVAADVLAPNSYSVEATRAAGFPGNSNWGALTVVALCAVSLRYEPNRHRLFDSVLLAASGLAVFATLSRSGAVNYMLLLVLYVLQTFVMHKGSMRKGLTLLVTGSIVIMAFMLVVPYVLSSTEMFSHSNAEDRLFGLFEGRAVDDGSSAERFKAARHALELIQEAPLLGHGTGYTRTMGVPPHNLYLQQWVNNGVLGLMSYLALLLGALLMFAGRRFPQGVGLVCAVSVGSLFSHNVLEQRYFLILLGALSTISMFRVLESPNNRSESDRNNSHHDI